MNKYMISRLYVQNFKSIDEATIVFDGENLNVLDGPNGFGKTTIYDAIQLLLTGTIRRVESNKIVAGNKGFNDHLFSKDQNKSTEIIIEFRNIVNNSTLALQRILLPPVNMNKTQKKPQNFKGYELYKLKNFEDKTEKVKLDNNQLDKLFSMREMVDKFNLYQYIEQEESTHLFKRTDKDRMDLISKLFNIEEEVNQKEFLEKVKQKLRFHKSSLIKNIEKIENKYEKNDLETAANKNKTKNITTKYIPLISSTKLNIPWDNQRIHPLDSSLKETYLSELDVIELLINNKNDFKRELKNETIERVVNAEDKLKAIIVFGHFHNQFDELTTRNQNQEKFLMILNKLKEKEFIKNPIDWDFVFQFINLPFNKIQIEQKIVLIESYSQSANYISSLIAKMIQTRDKLESQFNSFKELNSYNAMECPFCGDTKSTFEELTAEIDTKTKSFKELLDSDSRVYNEMLTEFNDEYILKIIKAIEEWLQENKIDSEFFKQLLEYKNIISDMDNAKKWFVNENIKIEKFINYNEIYVDDVKRKLNKLKNEIMQKIEFVGEDCKNNFVRFKRIFSDYLKNDWNQLNQISKASLRNKREYIDMQYFLQTSNNFKEVEKLKIEVQEIESKLIIIDSLINKFRKKINAHRAKMLNDIEIPFYIYSGKIIQNHQRGIGVLIKEEKTKSNSGDIEISSLSFIPPVDTDHDIIHSFSSGQLSSTVIAFTLALNKVYGNSGFMTLLIDDPIQTMDEMNMASFVELLRNDFQDRQLVISTHEDNISLYLRYKFLKYKLSVGNINVKQKLYTN